MEGETEGGRERERGREGGRKNTKLERPTQVWLRAHVCGDMRDGKEGEGGGGGGREREREGGGGGSNGWEGQKGERNMGQRVKKGKTD